MTKPPRPGEPNPGQSAIDYETAKSMATSSDQTVRQRLAARADIRPELLYFLANDKAVEVRREIAANTRTPRKADLLLSRDIDPDVRTGLARKIARLAPDLPQEQLNHIERTTLDILETLARDQATEVRRILADELKDVATAPAMVINLLARDVELSVCGPVLRNSPILTDEDLLEIIAGDSPDGALSAIAERANVGAAIADAIASRDNARAIAVLLANPSAQIREETLDRIIDRAPANEPWHAPLVRRPQLPARAAARLASFVADSLLSILQARTDLGPAAARQVADSVRHRLTRQPSGAADPGDADPPWASATRIEGPPKPTDPPWAAAAAAAAVPTDPPWAAAEPATPTAKAGAEAKGAEKSTEKPVDRVKRLNAEGLLDEEAIATALADGDRLFVVTALAELVGTATATVERVLATHSPRPVTAMVWRAGLSMRLARQVQLRLAQIPPKDALNARNGTEYPLSERDMKWQMEFFGIS